MRTKHILSPENVKPEIAKRFWQRVKSLEPNDCWEWTGSRLPERPSANGPLGHYGRLNLGGGRSGRVEYTHRIAFVLSSRKPIPAGMVVMHTCDNPPCCNPRHLSLGTFSENALDRESKGRRKKPRSETFVLEDRIEEVVRLYQSGMSGSKVAARIGACPASVYKALRIAGAPIRASGRRRRNVTPISDPIV